MELIPKTGEGKMIKVITLKDNVKTYARPSVNAIIVNEHPKAGKELIVYPSVQGWFELRPVDTDGVLNTEFVQKSDVKPLAIEKSSTQNSISVLETSDKKDLGKITSLVKSVIKGR